MLTFEETFDSINVGDSQEAEEYSVNIMPGIDNAAENEIDAESDNASTPGEELDCESTSPRQFEFMVLLSIKSLFQ